MRRPLSWAEITLVSLTTSWSPGSSHCGRSETVRSRKPPSGCTTSIRAESRGLAGRSAMLVGGKFEVEEIGAHEASRLVEPQL